VISIHFLFSWAIIVNIFVEVLLLFCFFFFFLFAMGLGLEKASFFCVVLAVHSSWDMREDRFWSSEFSPFYCMFRAVMLF
jgi:hypothetical protein